MTEELTELASYPRSPRVGTRGMSPYKSSERSYPSQGKTKNARPPMRGRAFFDALVRGAFLIPIAHYVR